jgi:hypothetical protein
MSRDYQHLIQKLHVSTGLAYNFIERTLESRIKEIVDEKIKEFEKKIIPNELKRTSK